MDKRVSSPADEPAPWYPTATLRTLTGSKVDNIGLHLPLYTTVSVYNATVNVGKFSSLDAVNGDPKIKHKTGK